MKNILTICTLSLLSISWVNVSGSSTSSNSSPTLNPTSISSFFRNDCEIIIKNELKIANLNNNIGELYNKLISIRKKYSDLLLSAVAETALRDMTENERNIIRKLSNLNETVSGLIQSLSDTMSLMQVSLALPYGEGLRTCKNNDEEYGNITFPDNNRNIKNEFEKIKSKINQLKDVVSNINTIDENNISNNDITPKLLLLNDDKLSILNGDKGLIKIVDNSKIISESFVNLKTNY